MVEFKCQLFYEILHNNVVLPRDLEQDPTGDISYEAYRQLGLLRDFVHKVIHVDYDDANHIVIQRTDGSYPTSYFLDTLTHTMCIVDCDNMVNWYRFEIEEFGNLCALIEHGLVLAVWGKDSARYSTPPATHEIDIHKSINELIRLRDVDYSTALFRKTMRKDSMLFTSVELLKEADYGMDVISDAQLLQSVMNGDWTVYKCTKTHDIILKSNHSTRLGYWIHNDMVKVKMDNRVCTHVCVLEHCLEFTSLVVNGIVLSIWPDSAIVEVDSTENTDMLRLKAIYDDAIQN